MATILDVIVEPRYDTNFIPTAGVQQLLFFAQPIGTGQSVWNAAAGATKNIADTNMDLAGQLPAGYNFVVLGFRIMASFNMTIADATLAFNAASFTFTIGSKDYLRVPVRTIPSGGGSYAGAGTAAGALASLGIPDLRNAYSIARQPLELAQTQNFNARINWGGAPQAVTTTMAGGTTAGCAGLPVTVFLDGFLKRLPQ